MINFNPEFKTRYKAQFYTPLKTEGIYNYIKGIPYGAHFSTAYKIFKENPISGIGLKNFYFECGKDKYIDKEFAFNHCKMFNSSTSITFRNTVPYWNFWLFSFYIFILLFNLFWL